MLLDDALTLQEKWTVILMFYGAQSDDFDYHNVINSVFSSYNLGWIY